MTAFVSMSLALLLSIGSVAAHGKAQRWEFQVFLDDKAIGHHRFVLNERGPERELTSDARFNVKLLFVNAYRYVHDATERWRDNCLVSLTARTDDNGKQLNVSAEQQGERVRVTTERGQETVPGCVMSFAYWNADILRQAHLLNPQTGQYEAVRISMLGEETITVRGATVKARRFRISGPKNPIDLWYGADNAWLALQSPLDGGRTLRYQIK